MNTLPNLKRIYLDSNALYRLGPRLENVDFEKLLELQMAAGFGLFVATPSWLEYLRWRKKEVSEFLESCRKVDRVLEKQGMSIPEIAGAREKVEKYLLRISEHYQEKAARRGITITALADIEVERLLRMSIDKVPPFEESENKSKEPLERGFRDALILFSILEDIREQGLNSAMVVTEDNLLGRAFEEHGRGYGIDMIVKPTIDEANAYLNGVIVGSERIRIKRESAEAIQMLTPYSEDIAKEISAIRELTEIDLGQGSLWFGLDRERLEIKAVQSISLDKIDSAVWKNREEAISRILFRCACKALVFIRAPYQPQPWNEPRRFKIGEPPPAWPMGALLSFVGTAVPTSDATEQRELRFHVYGVAEIERAGSDWKLMRLRIDKSLPAEEEYYALVDAELPNEP